MYSIHLKVQTTLFSYVIYTRIFWSDVKKQSYGNSGGRNKLGDWDWYIHMWMWKLLSHVQLFATLWTVACQAPLSMGFSRQKYQSGLPFPPTGDLPNPGIDLRSPLTAGKSLLSETPGKHIYTLSSVQSLSRVRLFVTPWIAARQASLSITISRSSLRLTSIESLMPSSHLILCRPLLLLPPVPPSIRVFSSESTLRMRWPKYWSFSFSIIPSKEIPK